MLFVLVLHANFLGIHAPSHDDLIGSPFSTFMRCFVEAIAIVAVDVFVLISGWFGMHFSFKKLGSLCFQVLFFSLGFFFVFAIVNLSEAFTIEKIKGILLMNGDYWFVKAYVVLFILSPVLNSFVEHVTKRQFQLFLITYYSFHTIYGWLMDASVSFTMNGTTALSFIGLYLLGRYLKEYPLILCKMSKKIDLLLYILCALLLTLCNIILLYKGYSVSVQGRLYSYASPLVILEAVFLLLFFSKLSFSSKTVNWVASSCFAVYLFHCNGFFVVNYYRNFVEYIYYDTNYAFYGVIAYVVFIYFVSVLLDKMRIALWSVIFRH
jgi:hypothetical protein